MIHNNWIHRSKENANERYGDSTSDERGDTPYDYFEAGIINIRVLRLEIQLSNIKHVPNCEESVEKENTPLTDLH